MDVHGGNDCYSVDRDMRHTFRAVGNELGLVGIHNRWVCEELASIMACQNLFLSLRL